MSYKQQLFDKAINIYRWGSFVYGTLSEESDCDYLVILADGHGYPEQFHVDNEDFNIFSESQWIEMCKNNEIETLESAFLPDHCIVKETKKYELQVNYDLVRKVISAISSNSFVKCRKKLKENSEDWHDFNPRVGKKSLWHSLRLYMFGIQIMNTGKIYDYSEANKYYDDIVNNPCNDWEYYKNKYKPIHNKLHSDFKKAHENAMS